MKVFCIGMYKTGTTSCVAALRYLKQCTSSEHLGLPDLKLWYEEGWKDSFAQYFDQLKYISSLHDTFGDSPWLWIFDELDQWHPGSKFILTLRKDSETVAQSDTNWWRKNGCPEEDIVPPQQFIDRYETHNERVRDYFKDREDDLLEICFDNGDGWKEICDFLSLPIPNIPFPHANKGVYK